MLWRSLAFAWRIPLMARNGRAQRSNLADLGCRLDREPKARQIKIAVLRLTIRNMDRDHMRCACSQALYDIPRIVEPPEMSIRGGEQAIWLEIIRLLFD